RVGGGGGRAPAPGLRAEAGAAPIVPQTASTKRLVMWLHSVLTMLGKGASRGRPGRRAAARGRGRPGSCRPAVEPLEDRWVPSTLPNDPMFGRLDGLQVAQAPQAWDLTTGSTRGGVAGIDNRRHYTHPHPYKNIWPNQAEIPAAVRPKLRDTDGDGLITFWDLNEPVNQGPGKITDLNGTGYIDGGDLLRPADQGGWADGRDNGNNGYVDDLVGW